MALGGFQSAWGKAFKYLPMKATFLASVFIFEVGSLLCGLAPSSMVFVIGRAIAGVGAAGIACGTMTISEWDKTGGGWWYGADVMQLR